MKIAQITVRKIMAVLVCLTLLLGFASISEFASFKAGAMGSAMPLNFEGYDSLEDMEAEGMVVNGTTTPGRFSYSLNKDMLYAHSGDSSLKATFLSANADSAANASCFEINLDENSADADGISFWYYNPNNVPINGLSIVAVAENDTRYKYTYSDAATTSLSMSANMDGFQKCTLRFDTFRLLSDSTKDWSACTVNTEPAKDIIASFKKIVIRVVLASRNGLSVYLDSFELVYDRDVETFNQSELPSNVTITGRLNNAADNEFFNSTIVDSPRGAGKALKLEFGYDTNEASEADNNLNNAHRSIKVTINTEGMNLNGDALQLLMMNYSNAPVGMRIQIFDSTDQGHRHRGPSISIGAYTAAMKNSFVESKYDTYQKATGILSYVTINAANNSNFAVYGQLQNTKTLNINIYPREANNGGYLLIDNIAVANPVEELNAVSGTSYAAEPDSGIANGTIAVNTGRLTANQAEAGDKVSVTVTPAAGYQVKAGSLVVRGADGNAIAVPTRSGFRQNSMSDSYEFIMPAGDVTVYAEFIPAASANPNMGLLGRSIHTGAGGLRFVFRMNKKPDNTIMVGGIAYTITRYGALLTSQEVIDASDGAGREDLKLDYTEAASPLNGLKEKIINVDITEGGVKYDECAQYVDFSICITGLSGDNMKNKIIVSRPYVVYNNGTNDVIYYLDAAASTFASYTQAS